MLAIGVALLVALLCAVATGAAVRRAGEDRATAWTLGGVVAVMSGAVIVAAFFAAFGECFGEGDPPPSSYWWSPRRRYCEEGSLESFGGLALILLPALGMVLGTVLRRRALVPAIVAYALVPLAPIAPFLYLEALPYYETDETEVYFDPELGPAEGDRGPRICMRHGIASSEARGEDDDPTEPRVCVDLEPTAEALALTTEYDEGGTPYALDRLADELSRHGASKGEAVDGLVVSEVHEMTLEEAGLPARQVDGDVLPTRTERADSMFQVVARVRKAAALMDGCGRVRGSYARCRDDVFNRVSRDVQIRVTIRATPDLPHQYVIEAQGVGGSARAERFAGTPRNGPPVISCNEQYPCPIAG